MAVCSIATVMAAALSIAALSASAAEAQPRHRHAGHRLAQAQAAPLYGYGHGYGNSNIAPMNPAYGYSESPYDPTYRGPGWEVFAMQHRVEQQARVLHEVDPAAKISATGIVVGGD